MRRIPLAVVLGLVAPALAQTESRPTVSSPPAAPTQKLWKIETSGLGG